MSCTPPVRPEIPRAPIDSWPLPLGLVSILGWGCVVPLYFTPIVLLGLLLPFASVAAVVTGVKVLRRLKGTANSRIPALFGTVLGALSLTTLLCVLIWAE
ncbi:hypothetical protein [Streptomyces erythrochromogenes]|uniref:hypothetical protein n=1 Tax=Streptomyces erythrochromogenes TaxID=285574 RepID=UPI003687836B